MPFDKRSDGRKLKQLCREAYRVLAQVLPDALGAIGVTVVDVRPAPDGSRLAVGLAFEAGTEIPAAMARLAGLKGHLRSELASAIQRKRTPDLVFEVVA